MNLDQAILDANVAITKMDRIRVWVASQVKNQERGDPWFETKSSVGGAVGNMQHARGMLLLLKGIEDAD